MAYTLSSIEIIELKGFGMDYLYVQYCQIQIT